MLQLYIDRNPTSETLESRVARSLLSYHAHTCSLQNSELEPPPHAPLMPRQPTPGAARSIAHIHTMDIDMPLRYQWQCATRRLCTLRLMICIPTYGGGRCHAHGSRRMHAASRVREHSSSGGRCIVRGHMERIPKLEQFTQPRSCKRPTARCRAARRLPPAKCHQADLHQAARRAPHRASVRSSPRRGSA